MIALSFIGSAIVLARVYGARRPVDVVLLWFLFLSAEILAAGYALSAWSLFGSATAWTIVGAGILALVLGRVLDTPRLRRAAFAPISWPAHGLATVHSLSWYDRLLLIPPAFVVILLGIVNLTLVLFVAPHTVDALNYTTARVGYYLQHGTLAFFDANYPAQVAQAKNPAVLLGWAFLASGRREAGFSLVQFTAYWVAIVAIYGITRAAGAGRRYAAFAALVFGLLTICLMQASTPQNDLLAATYFACAVYFLLSFRREGAFRDLAWAALAIGIALGLKATAFVAMPALTLIGAFVVMTLAAPRRRRALAVLVVATAASISAFTVPAGYVDNYQRYGIAFTPIPAVANYALVNHSATYIANQGTRNLARFAFDFLSLDGLPPFQVVTAAQTLLRWPARAAVALGLDLEENGVSTRPRFATSRRAYAREEFSYFGVLGVGFLWMVPIVAWRGARTGAAARVLASASIVYFVTVAFTSEYDPWRGRLFIPLAVFAIPAIACAVQDQRGRVRRAYVLAIVLAGCVSGLTAVIFREHAMPISVAYGGQAETSVFLLDRPAQLTRHVPQYTEALRRFEAIVPPDATIAIYGDYMFEYVFFGDRLTRRLMPVGDGREPLGPATGDVLLFSSKSLELQAGDIYLGVDWFLRRRRALAVDLTPRAP